MLCWSETRPPTGPGVFAMRWHREHNHEFHEHQLSEVNTKEVEKEPLREKADEGAGLHLPLKVSSIDHSGRSLSSQQRFLLRRKRVTEILEERSRFETSVAEKARRDEEQLARFDEIRRQSRSAR